LIKSLLFGISLAGAAIAMSEPAMAQSSSAKPTASAETIATFIAPGDIALQSVLPPWPQPGSLAEAADIETMLAVQRRRSPADAADAQADSVTMMPQWTAQLLGVGADKLPHTFALMQALHDDMRSINRAANTAQGFRVRPSLYDARIQPSLDLIGHGNASYPSARASSSAVWAAVIARLVPEKAAAAAEVAERIAWRRVVGGVHYPSDIAGSRRVAAAVVQALEKQQAFIAAIGPVCSELAAVKVTAACHR
jgi:acid phosphatase (class A)